MSDLQAITAQAKDWIAALTRLSPAMVGKKPLAILTAVHIDPAAGVLSGYDFETSAVTTLDALGEGAPFLVSYRWLLDAIRATSGKTKTALTTVTLDGKKVTVESCGYEVHAEALPVDDYPEIPDVPATISTEVPACEFRAALRRAVVAASAEEIYPVLEAVQISMVDGALELQATDRYRLAEDHVAGEGSGCTKFLLKRRTIKSLDRFLVGGNVQISVHDNRVAIKTEDVTFTTISVDGDFPKIKSLFPDAVKASFEVDRAVLLESTRVAKAMNDRFAPCFVRLFDGGAEVTFNDGLFGPSRAPVAIGEVVAGVKDEVSFGMNPNFLIEALVQIPTDKVSISYTTAPKPFLFQPAGAQVNDPKSPKHLIMPVRMPQ
ncbi:DNA polymerase III subunit beta [Arthrobacter sp. B2a2-09]|uniref:DNA polymerase III subunit beta n=1 Tax=Arthrobacter sp. B2a2-09 TaxID=2952822 RepID=UPI0022CD7FFF|nr:DNA polymerase III subunit beta [Arthrobacter sp. B2a2-09]MCZ9884123.1 DNA polymerase III subunit beta [Arthrobacter sp. B2a2-09]